MDEIDPEILTSTLKLAQADPLIQIQALESHSRKPFPSELSFILGYVCGHLKISPNRNLLLAIKERLVSCENPDINSQNPTNGAGLNPPIAFDFVPLIFFLFLGITILFFLQDSKTRRLRF